MNAAWGRLISLPKKRQRKPLLTTATMLLLAMLTATPAWAQNIYTSQIGNRPAVVVSGDITANADEVFKAAAGQLQAPLVFLSSAGGNVAAALEIGRFIRMRALETVVAEQQSCFSACALIWLGGAQRFMGQNARIGFHAAYRVRNGRTEESGVGNAMIGSYLANLGLPERVVMYVTLPGPDETQLLSMADARRIGLAASLLPAGYAQPDRQVAQQVAPARPTVAPGQGGSGFPVAVGQSFRDCADACPEMVVIPAGRVTMGSPASELGRDGDEGPQHDVVVRSPLAVGKYEVTFEEWDACVAANGCAHRPSDEGWGRGRQPVLDVSWNDAQQYVAWLSRRTGQRYRLLTEAEWEYAARAGTVTAYSFGVSVSPSLANYRESGLRRTQIVGRYPANGFGLHDVHGNVMEWVQDCYAGTYYGAPSDAAQVVTGGGCSSRVVRGGSWNDHPRDLRSADRDGGQPGARGGDIGFRVARTPGG